MTDRQQEVRDFLENTIKEKGFSLNSLSLQIGKNSTYLFHFIKRHSPRRLDEPSRLKLAKILDIPEHKLCDFPISGGIIQDKLSTISGLLGIGHNKDNTAAIEIIDMDGEQKGNFDNIKNNVIGIEYMSFELLKHYNITNAKNIKIIKNNSDAMSPMINSGDMLITDISYKTPSIDGIYLINAMNSVILRRLQINPLDNSAELSATNTSYKSINISKITDIGVCGKVLWVVHKL